MPLNEWMKEGRKEHHAPKRRKEGRNKGRRSTSHPNQPFNIANTCIYHFLSSIPSSVWFAAPFLPLFRSHYSFLSPSFTQSPSVPSPRPFTPLLPPALLPSPLPYANQFFHHDRSHLVGFFLRFWNTASSLPRSLPRPRPRPRLRPRLQGKVKGKGNAVGCAREQGRIKEE